MNEFSAGPFTFRPAGRSRWTMHYGSAELGMHTVSGAKQSEIAGAFDDYRADWIREQRREHAPGRVDLIDSATGEAVAGFFSDAVPDMTPGLIDDRSRYWLRSADRLRSRPVSLSEYGRVVRQCAAPEMSWITGLLPDDVLTDGPELWRPPTSWEIRHIVGRGSLTGVSGAKAAALVGVLPASFRKYTAADGAKTRQNMGFAMWHALLHRLRVQNLPA